MCSVWCYFSPEFSKNGTLHLGRRRKILTCWHLLRHLSMTRAVTTVTLAYRKTGSFAYFFGVPVAPGEAHLGPRTRGRREHSRTRRLRRTTRAIARHSGRGSSGAAVLVTSQGHNTNVSGVITYQRLFLPRQRNAQASHCTCTTTSIA